MTAQAIMFYIASFEATVSALAHIIYYLAKYQDLQQKVYEEIKSSNFSYEELHELKYLSAFINESLRLSPSAIFIPRVCVKDFKLKGIFAIFELSFVLVIVKLICRNKYTCWNFNRGLALRSP